MANVKVVKLGALIRDTFAAYTLAHGAFSNLARELVEKPFDPEDAFGGLMAAYGKDASIALGVEKSKERGEARARIALRLNNLRVPMHKLCEAKKVGKLSPSLDWEEQTLSLDKAKERNTSKKKAKQASGTAQAAVNVGEGVSLPKEPVELRRAAQAFTLEQVQAIVIGYLSGVKPSELANHAQAIANSVKLADNTPATIAKGGKKKASK